MARKESEQSRRAGRRLRRKADHQDAAEWLQTLANELIPDGDLARDTLATLEQHLRGHYGAEYTKIGDDHQAHIDFWRTMADAFPLHPRLRAILADTLLISGRDRAQCFEELVAAFRADPALVPEFAGDFHDVAHELGRAFELEFRLAELRFAALDDDDLEYTNTLTRELLMEFGTNADTIGRIKACARPREE